jgi:hypothetical protein
VELTGIEADATSATSVTNRRVHDADRATRGDSKQPEVSAAPADTDEAIRAAAKLATDAGDPNRARALLDLLDAKPKQASVLTLATWKLRPR